MLVQPVADILEPGIYSGSIPLQFSDGRVQTVDLTLVQGAADSASLGKGPQEVRQAACAPQSLLPRARSLGSGFGVSAGWRGGRGHHLRGRTRRRESAGRAGSPRRRQPAAADGRARSRDRRRG